MEKSPDAFRTISEVSAILDTPAHVLRFWESRFPQVKPVKRAGGRRYYRPSDLALLSGIRQLLHDDGLTIKGVQKLLREQGVRHVAGLGAALVAALPAVVTAEPPPTDTARETPRVPATPQGVALGENPVPTDMSASSDTRTVSPHTPSEPQPVPAVVVPLKPGTTVPGLSLKAPVSVAEDARPRAAQSHAPKPDAPEAPMLFDAPLLPHQSRVTPITPPMRPKADAPAPAQTLLASNAPEDGTPPESAAPSPSVLRPGLADAPRSQMPVDTLDIDDDSHPPALWVPSLLRRVPPARLAAHTAALQALHARLAMLRDKTNAAAHPSHR